MLRAAASAVTLFLSVSCTAASTAPLTAAALAQVPPEREHRDERPIVPQLTVRGEASLDRPADEARLSISVVTEHADAREALEQNSERMTAVIKALEDEDLTDREYQTGRFQVQPMYSRRPPRAEADWEPKIVGYRVTNSLQITTTKLNSVGEYIAAANEAGANAVDSVSFGLADERKHRAEAINEAARNAIADAHALARAANVRLVRILSISLDDARQMPVVRGYDMMMGRAAVAESVAPPIEAGDITVRASVNIVYEIASAE